LKPIIPNPKEPWKICPKQLADLDSYITSTYGSSTIKLDEGIKYGRWAIFYDTTVVPAMPYDVKYLPDNIFDGSICGRKQVILMWLPFFD
jgi:hypothetical protein